MADPTAPRGDVSGVAPIATHRLTPTGVLPRRGQMWLMLGVAGGLVAIILLTGNQQPAAPRAAAAPPSLTALAPNPDQLRDYQRRLEATDPRPHALPPAPGPLRPIALEDRPDVAAPSAHPQDSLAEERRRRDYESLFASNVVQSPTLPTTDPSRSVTARRPLTSATAEPTAPPSLDDVANAVVRAAQRPAAPAATPVSSVAASPAAPAPASAPPPEITVADGPVHRLIEGTIIDTILTNRLDGGAASPVNCLVSNPIYASNQEVLIPAGARVLGTTKPVQSFGETRLAVAFDRLLMPNGRTYSLEQFSGANAIGDSGLRDQVNRHYASTFGISAAVGLISGFAQYVGGGFWNRSNNSPVVIVGNVTDATAQAATQTMGHLLNRLPTITIREGHRVKVYLTSDLQLPGYRASQPDRGIRVAGRTQP